MTAAQSQAAGTATAYGGFPVDQSTFSNRADSTPFTQGAMDIITEYESKDMLDEGPMLISSGLVSGSDPALEALEG